VVLVWVPGNNYTKLHRWDRTKISMTMKSRSHQQPRKVKACNLMYLEHLLGIKDTTSIFLWQREMATVTSLEIIAVMWTIITIQVFSLAWIILLVISSARTITTAIMVFSCRRTPAWYINRILVKILVHPRCFRIPASSQVTLQILILLQPSGRRKVSSKKG